MTSQKTQPEGTRINASPGKSETNLDSAWPKAYQSPTLRIDRLALITLGGSPNPGDSGTEGTQGPPQ